jgi:hypothetical protein
MNLIGFFQCIIPGTFERLNYGTMKIFCVASSGARL